MKIFDAIALEKRYLEFREPGYDQKWLNFSDFQPYLEKQTLDQEIIGYSFMQLPISKLTIGTGKKRLLIWSQMHGNESTGTRAMMDVLAFLQKPSYLAKHILEAVTIDFIPMLNPDGANVNTRRNAVGIDMNRDFLAKQSIEINVLIDQVQKGQYDVLFNLHDQRTIFNVGTSALPATLSFLAPSYNQAEEVNAVRQHTMGIIQAMNVALQELIPGQVGRYTSEFYPRSTGDNFTLMGFPTVLVEAGHFPNDYERNQTRKYNAIAMLSALETIATGGPLPFQGYEEIPQNGQRFLDIIIRNVTIQGKENSTKTDLGIYFEEEYCPTSNSVQRIGYVNEIGDLQSLLGHLDLDGTHLTYRDDLTNIPYLGMEANFTVGSWTLIKGHLTT